MSSVNSEQMMQNVNVYIVEEKIDRGISESYDTLYKIVKPTTNQNCIV